MTITLKHWVGFVPNTDYLLSTLSKNTLKGGPLVQCPGSLAPAIVYVEKEPTRACSPSEVPFLSQALSLYYSLWCLAEAACV